MDYEEIPDNLKRGLRNYLFRRIPTGGFLRTILENGPVVDCIGRADEYSMISLRLVCYLIYNTFPGGSWGSKENVQRWLSDPDPPREELIREAKEAIGDNEENG